MRDAGNEGREMRWADETCLLFAGREAGKGLDRL